MRHTLLTVLKVEKKYTTVYDVVKVPYLMKKAPELSVMLGKKFVNEMPAELVAQVARAVAENAPEDSIALCRMRINEDILRSHVHYDKAGVEREGI